ncbi:MAG: hypothetical protein ACUVVU_09090, partial [Tepidimonas sp.]
PGLLASDAVHPAVRALPPAQALSYTLAGGDDYELVFTAAAEQRAAVLAAARAADTPVTRIGRIEAGPPAAHPLDRGTTRVRLCDAQGRRYALPPDVRLDGFDHFATMRA